MDDNPEMAITTRKRLVEMAALKNAPVIAFHMPFPSVGYIEKTSSGFKWLPATYQMNI